MCDYAELITRLKQSDDNCNAECCECSGECLSSGCNIFSEAADAIEELLAELVTIRKQLPHWISVEERLPEQYKPVLVTYLGFNTKSLISDMIAYLDGDGDWCWWDGDFPSGELCVVNITHWMPLPAPPTEPKEG